MSYESSKRYDRPADKGGKLTVDTSEKHVEPEPLTPKEKGEMQQVNPSFTFNVFPSQGQI